MTARSHRLWDDFDDPDALDDDADEFDGFHLDIPSGIDYLDVPECDFGFGDSDGYCIRLKYGCNIEGCQYAKANY